MKKINVVFFQRKQRNLGNFSVEIYFKQVIDNLPLDINPILIEMPFISNGFFKRFFNILYCILKQGDVNHITGDIQYVAMFLKKKKTILTILDCGSLLDFDGLKKIIFKKLWFDIPIKKSKYITAISLATQSDIIKHTNCDETKIKVIYFLSNSKFRRSEKAFNNNMPVLLQIGTAPNKNILRLIEAIKDIKCKLVIVGKLNLEVSNLLNLNNINYVSYEFRLTDEEIENLYVDADIITFVSTLEGFGMPIIEGNLVGRLVVTSNVTSMPEVAGESAILVDPYSISSIRNGIINAIENENERNKYIELGYANAKRFDPIEISAQYANLYREILK
jgi:glycosyltransferase involved in cell wall biosynthesis